MHTHNTHRSSQARPVDTARTGARRTVGPLVVSAALLAASLGASPLVAQTRGTSASSTTPRALNDPRTSPDSTQGAVNLMATVDHDEIAGGRYALTRATRADVKAYAQKMIDEHSQALQQLRARAGAGAWVVPDSMPLTSMGGMTGAVTGAMTGSAGNAGGMTGGMRAGRDSMGRGSMRDTMSRGGMRDSMMRSGMTGNASHSAMGDSTMHRAMQPEGEAVAAIHKANVDAMKVLEAASAGAFDKAYLDSQVAGHMAVLAALDKHMSDNSTLKPLMTSFRSTVQQHLDEARKLVSQATGN